MSNEYETEKDKVKAAAEYFINNLKTPPKRRPSTPSGSRASITRRPQGLPFHFSSPSRRSDDTEANDDKIGLFSRKRRRVEGDGDGEDVGDGEDDGASEWNIFDTEKEFSKGYKPQSAARHISQFLDLNSSIQEIILGMEYDKFVELPCQCTRGLRTFRCCDCSNPVTMCKQCIVEKHTYDQFHWVERWNSDRFMRCDLSEIGMKVYVGHGEDKCPEGEEAVMTIVDINGVHNACVVFCCCSDNASRALQLVKARIFPVTTLQPRTGITFRNLKDFHIHTRASKKSAYDYSRALERMSNDPSRKWIPMPTDAFTRIVRLWRYLAVERESGRLLGLDKHVQIRPKDSVAQVCLACPIPGFNTPKENDDKEQDCGKHLDTLYLAIDGNMKLFGFAKNSSLEDKALWNGSGYFRREELVLSHIKQFKRLPIKRGDCRDFKATEQWNSKRYRNQSSTGIMSVLCRHDIVRHDCVVNLQRGERFVNADLSLKGALQGTEDIKQRVCAYDIACQFVANLRERWNLEFPDYDIENLVLLIGKMHITNHVELCQWFFSFYFQTGVGRMDGEGVERFWSEVNHAAGSTKQMGHGHRMDTLDDLIDDWNKTKIFNLAKTMARNIVKAKKKLVELKLSLKESEDTMRARHGSHVVDKWRSTPLEPVRVGKRECETPFRSKTPGKTLESILRKVVLEEINPTRAANEDSRKGRSEALIDAALLLQHRQRALGHSLKFRDESDPDSLLDQEDLRHDIEYWRQSYLHSVSLPGLREALEDDSETLEAKDEQLFIPSDFTKEERSTYRSLVELAPIERKIREKEAIICIRNLKNACRQVFFFKDQAWAKTRRTTLGTRSNTIMHNATVHKGFWMQEYCTIRKKLLALGMSEDDAIFRVLTEKDTVRPSTNMASSLGKGGDAPGWIWTVSTGQSEVEEQAWIVEDDRVQWFRHLAAMLRWKEEVEILEEEMRRLICGLDRLRMAWTALQLREQAVGVHAKAAFASAKIATYNGLLKEARSQFTLLDISLGRFTKEEIFGDQVQRVKTLPH